MERGGDASHGLAMVTRTCVVLMLLRRIDSSFLGAGFRGDRFLRGDIGTAAATSSVPGAVLVCDC
jgi:hypothetical protein